MNKKDNKNPSMTDIAKKVGVSRQLVSLVLSNSPGPSEETRKKVKQAASELNYHPHVAARMLRSKSSNMIGVLYSLNLPFQCEIIEKLYPEAKKRGYSLILSAVSEDHNYNEAIEELMGFRCEAVIVMDSLIPASKWSEIEEYTPVLILGHERNTNNLDYVTIDDEYGIFKAVDHLYELGHRNIAFLAGGGLETDIRQAAYLERMNYYNLRNSSKVYAGDGTEEAGYFAAIEILKQKKRPSAVIASNDNGAIGLLHTLKEKGMRIPDDISIVGYDDTRQARLSYIELTTVHQDTQMLAHSAIKLISERLKGERNINKGIVLVPSLVIRKTTKKYTS